MSNPSPEPVDLAEAVVRVLDDDGINPWHVRRVLRIASNVAISLLQQGSAVRFKGLCVLSTFLPKQREFESNLPHLRGRCFKSRQRYQLRVKPEQRMKKLLDKGIIDHPHVSGGPPKRKFV